MLRKVSAILIVIALSVISALAQAPSDGRHEGLTRRSFYLPRAERTPGQSEEPMARATRPGAWGRDRVVALRIFSLMGCSRADDTKGGFIVQDLALPRAGEMRTRQMKDKMCVTEP